MNQKGPMEFPAIDGPSGPPSHRVVMIAEFVTRAAYSAR